MPIPLATLKTSQFPRHIYYEVWLERLEEKLNVCLDSYYTDRIVYFEEESDFINYQEKKRLPEEEQKRISTFSGGQGVYKIYFNFTRRIDDMLTFFYAVANDFQTWGSHSMEKIYSVKKGWQVDSGMTQFDRNFLPEFRWSDYKTKEVCKAIIINFWQNEHVLDLPDETSEQITYVEEHIRRFVVKI